jgi:hypothetical protein
VREAQRDPRNWKIGRYRCTRPLGSVRKCVLGTVHKAYDLFGITDFARYNID